MREQQRSSCLTSPRGDQTHRCIDDCPQRFESLRTADVEPRKSEPAAEYPVVQPDTEFEEDQRGSKRQAEDRTYDAIHFSTSSLATRSLTSLMSSFIFLTSARS